ncbi:MAG: error-prone DNA polymerase [Myxococcota bacterium]
MAANDSGEKVAFAELLGRSCFSFLEGASQPRELVAEAHALGLEAIALTDRDGLYGSVRMHVAGEKRAQRVIVGAELTLESVRASEPVTTPHPYRTHRRPTVSLLGENHEGYCGLCRLLTEAHAEHEKGEAGLSVEAVAAEAAGLFAVVPLDPRQPLATAGLGMIRDAFGPRCALATWRHLDPLDRPRVEAAIDASSRVGIPIVASARPRFHHRARKPLADVVQAIRLNTTLAELGDRLAPNAEACLKSGATMRRLFPRHPEWIARTVEVAARCRFSLGEICYHFPSEFGQPGLRPIDNLRLEVAKGCRERYPDGTPPEVQAQLQRELRLIEELDVAPYFSSVKQVVEIARARRILCQGRGSAANSAVCYVLGITSIDPVRSKLLFERFMSSARREPPDIDVDFEHERREEVIQELYARYGRDRAAMVSEIICFRGKSALREVGKVFGLAGDQLDRLTSVATYFSASTDADDAALAKRGLDPRDAGLQHVVAMAEQLAGTPRHLSIHTGGFVLSAEPLYTVAPVEPGRMADRTVVPWDKDDIEDLGFFKVDVLGLGMLTAIRKALESIHEGPEPFDPIVALGRIPAEQPEVYDACCAADTVGIFQIESRAQMAMLPILRPRAFYDLVVEVGIVRPGPIQGGMVHPYLRRRTGEEEVTYPHPCLEPILARTLGVPLFQEQVMQLAITGAGYDPGEADQLRRDMAAWRKNGQLEKHRMKLLEGFVARGIPEDFAHRMFRQIQGFGEYGFPESHAASFAILVYASAWIKVHHPAAFACALINSQPMGFYSPATIVRDAQKHEVAVRPIRVEHSDWDCTLEPDGEKDDDDGAPALRLGFRLVKGVSEAGIASLVAARAAAPLTGVDDVVRRTRLRRDEVERLAEAGAFEGLASGRREAMWRVRAPRERQGLWGDTELEAAGTSVGLPRLSAREQLSLDYGTTGISIHDHPLRHLRPQLQRRRVRRAEEQPGFTRGQRVTVAGVVLTRQRPATASGVVFLTLEDETGTFNVVLYNHVFERYELVARHASIVLVRGKVDRRGPVVHVQAHHLERLDLPSGSAVDVRSRDFH